MFVRVLYCIFLGILVCLFVVWSMITWFPTPMWETEYPDVQQWKDQPIPPSSAELDFLSQEARDARVAEYEADRAEFLEWKESIDEREAEFRAKVDRQGATVALISLAIAVVVTSACLLYTGDLQVIAEGLLLGGIFTLIYSIGWSFARAPKFAVLTVGIGLIVTIWVGYKRFVKRAIAVPAPLEPPKE